MVEPLLRNIARLGEDIDELSAADRFSGCVMIGRDNEVLLAQARGLASRAHGIPNGVDTKFNLGSMNKMFTAVAVAQLAERGQLVFQDPVAKYWPDYPHPAVGEQVTIEHLLTHTSGLGDYFTAEFKAGARDRFRAVTDYLPLFVNEPLAFEPGARFKYSNAGFILLGALIEKASGQDYFTYVRENIYLPAGMMDTDAYEMDEDRPNLATGYTHFGPDERPRPGRRRSNNFLHVFKGGPAGGGFSTCPDLFRFDRALREHRLLAKQTTEHLIAGKVETGRGYRYALGFQEVLMNGHRIIGHAGSFAGISNQLDMYWDSGYTVAVLSNYDPPVGLEVAKKTREILAGHDSSLL
jgi:CubicO group peptidase (beta-lactamase class C family)